MDERRRRGPGACSDPVSSRADPASTRAEPSADPAGRSADPDSRSGERAVSADSLDDPLSGPWDEAHHVSEW